MALESLDRFRAAIEIINNSGQLNLTDPISSLVNATSLTLANDWGRRFYQAGLGGPPLIDDATGLPKDWDQNVTGEEKGNYAMDAHRLSLYGIANRVVNVPADTDAARQASKDAADAQTESDLGPIESDRGQQGQGRVAATPQPRQP